MQLIDDKLIPVHHGEVVIIPRKVRIVDDGITNRVGHFTGIGVDAIDDSPWCAELVFVVVADLGTFNVDGPEATRLGMHRMGGAIPVVEGTDNGDPIGMGRPDPKRHTIRGGDGSHPWMDRLIFHGSSLLKPLFHKASF